MAAPVKNKMCRVSDENLPKKSRQSICNEFVIVHDQLCEILGRIPQTNDGESSYVCSSCLTNFITSILIGQKKPSAKVTFDRWRSWSFNF